MCLEIYLPELYDDNILVIDKSLNFFYGKNGTGKSTLTNLIAKNGDQNDLAVLTFQGFESVLGENDLLNAVVIGEHNKKIELLFYDFGNSIFFIFIEDIINKQCCLKA